MNTYELKKHFNLSNGNTTVSREDFERFFTKTKERIEFTFNGWGGKSYDGESRRAAVYRTAIKGFEDLRLVKVGKGLHCIIEDSSILEKATGIFHKEAWWLMDVAGKEVR